MIYLKNTTEAQVAMIPRNGEIVTGDMSLAIRNTTDQEERTISVSDLQTSGIYFNLGVALPDGLADGEYEYQLLDGGVIPVSRGIIILGDFRRPDQYTNEITYQQYESK